MNHSTFKRAAAVAVIAGAGLTACGSAHPAQNQPASAAAHAPSASPAMASVKIVWSHTDQNHGDTQLWYVARVTNPASGEAPTKLSIRALDASGTIVGSDQPALPNIPAHSSFDYFGSLGGGINSLSGTPASVTASGAYNPGGAEPMRTSGLKLQPADPSAPASTTDTPYAYDMSVKVTNTTSQTISGGVTQQVVLYDSSGGVVGGGTGSSDNVPDSLPIGMSYEEQWTGVPALHPEARAVYTVWPAS